MFPVYCIIYNKRLQWKTQPEPMAETDKHSLKNWLCNLSELSQIASRNYIYIYRTEIQRMKTSTQEPDVRKHCADFHRFRLFSASVIAITRFTTLSLSINQPWFRSIITKATLTLPLVFRRYICHELQIENVHEHHKNRQYFIFLAFDFYVYDFCSENKYKWIDEEWRKRKSHLEISFVKAKVTY